MNNFYYIDLNDYFNHTCIAHIDNFNQQQNKNIGIDGFIFIPDNMPKNNLDVNNIKFMFPEVKENKPDNIVCKGQKIQCNDNEPQKIHFLGFSDWWSYKEDIEFEFLDSSTEKNKLFFHSWDNDGVIREYGSKELNCKVALKSMVQTLTYRHIFSYSIELNNYSQPIKVIKLPYNPCLHILAISIEENLDNKKGCVINE